MLKKISIDFLLYTIGPQIPRLFSFLLLPVFTKYLTATDYGYSGIINSYIGLFVCLADLGLNIRYSITYFKYPKTYLQRWQLLNGILFWWSISFSILQSAFLIFLLPDEMGTSKYIIILLNLFSNLFFSSWSSLCTRYLQFLQASIIVTIMSIISGFLVLFLNYTFIVYYKMGYLGWFYSSFIISLLQGLFSLYWLFIHKKLQIRFNIFHKSILSILFITVPLVLHNYSSYLLDASDRVIMSIYKINPAQIGLYNFAYIFAMYFDFITTSVGIATGPMFSKIFFSKNEHRYYHIKNLLIFFLLLFLLVAISISFFISNFFTIFISNQELWNCNYMVCILVFAYTYKPLYWYVSSMLSYNNKTNALWKMSLSVGIANVLLNIVLLPLIGLYACAITTFICLVGMCLVGSQFKSYKLFNTESFRFDYWILLIIALMLLSLAIQGYSVYFKLIILIFIFTISFIYIRYFYTSKIKPIQAIYK